jgi:hypothetical protein
LSISQLWLVDSLMQAFAAVLHGASVDGSAFGFGVVVLGGAGLVVGFVVRFAVLDVGVALLLDGGCTALLVVTGAADVVDGAVIEVCVVSVMAGAFCCPATNPTGVVACDEQALSAAVAAIAAPMTSFRTRIVPPSAV